MRGIAFLASAALILSLPFTEARGEEIEVRDVALRTVEGSMVLDADFAFDLTPRLADVVANGVPLYFNVEFELTRERWYWFDETAVSRRLQLRLSYHALSRQYRLATGPLQQSFPTLEEALNVLKRVRNWLVIERKSDLAATDYGAAVRMRLDAALLPKPFQVSALTGRDLQLESPWRRFIVRVQKGAPS